MQGHFVFTTVSLACRSLLLKSKLSLMKESSGDILITKQEKAKVGKGQFFKTSLLLCHRICERDHTSTVLLSSPCLRTLSSVRLEGLGSYTRNTRESMPDHICEDLNIPSSDSLKMQDYMNTMCPMI